MVVLETAYVLHVLAGGFWTGATLYVVVGILPPASDDRLAPATFVDQMHRLLLITRWTGIVLPVTGLYLLWVLYTPLDVLLETAQGLAVLAMLTLWGIMNGLIEMGVLRMRNTVEETGFGTYMAEGFPRAMLGDDATTAQFVAVGKPYLLASGLCAVLLLAIAGLLAVGVSW